MYKNQPPWRCFVQYFINSIFVLFLCFLCEFCCFVSIICCFVCFFEFCFPDIRIQRHKMRRGGCCGFVYKIGDDTYTFILYKSSLLAITLAILLIATWKMYSKMLTKSIVQIFWKKRNTISRVAQWKRVGLITQRSVDRNHSLLLLLFWR